MTPKLKGLFEELRFRLRIRENGSSRAIQVQWQKLVDEIEGQVEKELQPKLFEEGK